MIDKKPKPKEYPLEYYRSLKTMNETGFLSKAMEQGILKLKSDNSKTLILTFLFITLALFIIAGPLWLGILDDKFKSDISQEVFLEPNISTQNEYSFNPSTENFYQNNFTIIIYNELNCTG